MLNYLIIVNWAKLPGDRLIGLCATLESSAAWEEFMRRYHPVIIAGAVNAARRWGTGASAEIDDVVQEVYAKLCADGARVLTTFRPSQPEAIFGYIKVVATNVAHDFFRRRSAAKRGLSRSVGLAEVEEWVSQPDDMEQRLTLAEVDRILDAQTQGENGKRDRVIFHLYYRFGWTAQAISRKPGVNLGVKGVEAVLQRLTRSIRNRMAETQGIDAP